MNPDEHEPTGPPPSAGALGQGVGFARDHLMVLLIAGVVAVGIAITYLTRAQGERVPVAMPTPTMSSAGAPSVVGPQGPVTGFPGSRASSPSADASSASIVVQVLGPVKRPGVITVPEGTRVTEAIARCGGLTPSADPGELNLAAILHDADQLIIGTRADPGGVVRNGSQASTSGSGPSGSTPTVIELNTATLDQLDALPGIGPVTAQKILDWRAQHQRFSSVSELLEIDGIGPKTYARITPYVRT